jgi:hypothetical protein
MGREDFNKARIGTMKYKGYNVPYIQCHAIA